MTLQEILKNIKMTAIMFKKDKYINANLINKALQSLIDKNNYTCYYTDKFSDFIDEIEKIMKTISGKKENQAKYKKLRKFTKSIILYDWDYQEAEKEFKKITGEEL